MDFLHQPLKHSNTLAYLGYLQCITSSLRANMLAPIQWTMAKLLHVMCRHPFEAATTLRQFLFCLLLWQLLVSKSTTTQDLQQKLYYTCFILFQTSQDQDDLVAPWRLTTIGDGSCDRFGQRLSRACKFTAGQNSARFLGKLGVHDESRNIGVPTSNRIHMHLFIRSISFS